MWILFLVSCLNHVNVDHNLKKDSFERCEAYHAANFKTQKECEGYNQDENVSYREGRDGFFYKELKIRNKGFCYKKEKPVIKKEKFKIIGSSCE